MSSRLEKFSKLLWPTLGLCIVAQAVLVSFSVVGGTTVDNAKNNYYVLLDQKQALLEKKLTEPPGANAAKLRDLGLVYWQNNSIEMAEAYLREVWNEHNSNDRSVYDEQFVQDGLNLGGLYLDRGSNELAIVIYKRILEYDCSHLPPDDGRIARDWNNIGLAFLQTGEALPKLGERKAWFEQAIAEFTRAQKIFASSPKYEQQMVCSMQNLVVAYSESGEDDKAFHLSNLVNQHLDSWNRKQERLSSSQLEPVNVTPPAKQSLTAPSTISSVRI